MNKQWMVWAAAAAAVLASGSAMAQRAGDTVFGAGVMHLNTQDKGIPCASPAWVAARWIWKCLAQGRA